MVQGLKEKGSDIRDLLRSLSDQAVLESLKDTSKVSYQSGFNSWINFCVMLNELIPGCKPPRGSAESDGGRGVVVVGVDN